MVGYWWGFFTPAESELPGTALTTAESSHWTLSSTLYLKDLLLGETGTELSCSVTAYPSLWRYPTQIFGAAPQLSSSLFLFCYFPCRIHHFNCSDFCCLSSAGCQVLLTSWISLFPEIADLPYLLSKALKELLCVCCPVL